MAGFSDETPRIHTSFPPVGKQQRLDTPMREPMKPIEQKNYIQGNPEDIQRNQWNNTMHGYEEELRNK